MSPLRKDYSSPSHCFVTALVLPTTGDCFFILTTKWPLVYHLTDLSVFAVHVVTGVSAHEACGSAAEGGQAAAAPQAATGLVHSGTGTHQAEPFPGWY